MVRNLSQILGILVLTGMFPSEMVCAMENEGEESPHSSRLAKNVENETKKAGGQIGDGLRKFAGHFRKKIIHRKGGTLQGFRSLPLPIADFLHFDNVFKEWLL